MIKGTFHWMVLAVGWILLLGGWHSGLWIVGLALLFLPDFWDRYSRTTHEPDEFDLYSDDLVEPWKPCDAPCPYAVGNGGTCSGHCDRVKPVRLTK